MTLIENDFNEMHSRTAHAQTHSVCKLSRFVHQPIEIHEK